MNKFFIAVAVAAAVGTARASPVPGGLELVKDGGQWPFAYNWSKFPAAWFGANATNWEDAAQMKAIGKYSMAILGWQHLTTPLNFADVVYAQLAQCAAIKAANGQDFPCFVYCSMGWAFGQDGPTDKIMNDPAYTDYFLRNAKGPNHTANSGYEFSQTDCQQAHTSPGATGGRCVGHFWNFGNASARDYYVSELVAPLAASTAIDGVFFDAVNYGYAIPAVRPWGIPVTNIPNCTGTVWTKGGKPDYSGCGVLVNGTLDVIKRTTELLNKNNKIPMLANPAYFVQPANTPIWLDEARLVEELDGLAYSIYYESARAESLETSGYLANLLTESKVGVASAVHTYYTENATTHVVEDPTQHIAAFMLAQAENWYYFGSTGWWDDSYAWTDLYDKASACGKPTGAAKNTSHLYTRDFEHGCHVELNCRNTTKNSCVGSVTWATEE